MWGSHLACRVPRTSFRRARAASPRDARPCVSNPAPTRELWRSDMPNPRVVLITGASSGVGQSTARLLSQRGFTVFGTSRNPSSADSIPGVEMLSLDVRADDSVRACVEAVVSRSGRLDVADQQRGLRAGRGIGRTLIRGSQGSVRDQFLRGRQAGQRGAAAACASNSVGTSSTSARSLA